MIPIGSQTIPNDPNQIPNDPIQNPNDPNQIQIGPNQTSNDAIIYFYVNLYLSANLHAMDLCSPHTRKLRTRYLKIECKVCSFS